MMEVLEGDSIPYSLLAQQLFDRVDRRQGLIPFLGAGASLGPIVAAVQTAHYPDAKTLEDACQAIGIQADSHAGVVLRIGALLASHLDAAEKSGAVPLPPNRQRLTADEYPPSAGRLARMLSIEAKYTTLENVATRLSDTFGAVAPDLTVTKVRDALDRLATATGVADPPDALSNISSVFEKVSNRTQLWTALQAVF